LGLSDTIVEDICRAVSTESEPVVPANYNSPEQNVISGSIGGVHRAMKTCQEAGAKRTIELNVSGAFHSPLMTPARKPLMDKLSKVSLQDALTPIYANVNAQPASKVDEIRSNLLMQLESPVRWTQSIKAMADDGIERFIEVGPGRVLQGLNRRIDRSLKTIGVSGLDQLEALVNE
ncbi:MAG: ACP S-malonyltransferase, partial [FCB group bacterium]|nr:ACP S-malonyltransferase [FCB group bacterium]